MSEITVRFVITKPASCRKFPLAAMFFVLFTSCSVRPFHLSEVGSLPVAWRNAAAFPSADPQRDLSHWWASFSDPTLSALIRRSLDSSPDLDAAAALVREARANRDATAAALYPQVSGALGMNSRLTKAPGIKRDTSTTWSAGLDTSWEADIFGRNRSNLLAASYTADSAEENFHSIQASLAAEVATTYTSLQASKARLDVLKRNITAQEETFQIASWRTQAGEADSLEYSQAEASLQQAKASVPRVQQNLEQTANLLARLCGTAPGGLDSILASAGRGIPNPASRLALGIPADTLRQRPDLRQAGYQILAAAAKNKAARADRFPTLSLSGALSVTALSPAKMFDPGTVAANAAAGLMRPIFDAGRIRANIEATDAAIDQSLARYESTILVALSEVEDALIACKRTTEQIGFLESAVVAARDADTLARQRYEAGEVDFLQVIDSQRTLLSLEDSRISARTDRTTSFIRLYQALGGGWTHRSLDRSPSMAKNSQ